MINPIFSNISPGRILLSSFIFVISIGTLLLSLPQAKVIDIPFLDILFTATSSTCVTGLHVVPLSCFTLFGQCVILSLIQIGGLGLMTLSFFLISLIMNLKLVTKLLAGQILEFEFYGKIKTFLTLIMAMTFVSEIIGTIVLYFPLRQFFAPKKAFFYALFHSISAFCNSGTSPLANNLEPYINQPFILLPIAMLIFAGGLGFIVWYEIANFLRSLFKKPYERFYLSLHTKIVLATSLILIFLGGIFFFILELNHSLRSCGFFDKIVNSIFMSVTTRTAGFSSINIAQLSLPILLIFLILMFVGTSPNSTGGGIKTTTFTLFLATIITIIRNRSSIEIGNRTIPADQIYKTTAIVSLGLIWLITTTFILLITEKTFSFIQIFFEATSAFATAGLSTGITPYLSSTGKFLLMISMLFGRIGSLTLVLALRRKKEPQLYRYPEERIVIG